MEYSIGTTSFGHPVVWQREKTNGAWVGGPNFATFDPTLAINGAQACFALSLVDTIKVGDFLCLSYSGLHQSGWLRVDRYRAHELCFASGMDMFIPLLNAFGHYDGENYRFADGITHKDRLIWDHIFNMR